MYVFHNAEGRIYYLVKDHDHPYFRHTTNVELFEKYIADTPEMKALRIDMLEHERKRDTEGDPKYSIDTKTNLPVAKPGWKSAEEELDPVELRRRRPKGENNALPLGK